jgi:aryl-alcohol dehydrogenase-like predicted oxidoreductase
LTMAEVAFRWIAHSSLLRRESGDAVIIGGSSLKQIEEVCSFPSSGIRADFIWNSEPREP